MEYGAAFRGLSELWRGENEALALVKLPDHVESEGAFHFHPALLDACFQAIGAGISERHANDRDTVYLITGVDRIRVVQTPGRSVWAHVRVSPSTDAKPETFAGDIRLQDELGVLIAEVDGLRLKRANRQALRHATAPAVGDSLFEVAWSRMPRDEARQLPLARSEEHTSELQSHSDLVCRLLLEKKKKIQHTQT